MQYFKEPVHYQLDEMLQSVETLCASVDSIHEFRVIGGEPLMNKNVYGVIEKLSNIDKVKRVVIYTNGSIPINMKYIDILQNSKVILMITSYGDLSKNLSKMESVCDEYNITYHTRPAQGWTDSSKISQHHRDTKAQNDVFQSCCAKSLYTLSEGELHRCPFSANAARLGAIPDYKSDYINLLDSSIASSDNKKHMQKFTSNMTEALSACDFCNGRPLDDPQITPGIQTKDILDYTRIRT
jgi:molybdenum cofactor biosynthesis enzyme MoaA